MRARCWIVGLLMLICKISQNKVIASDQTSSALLPLEARSADLSAEEDVISSSYVLPNQIFNDGKPYYPRQDPISGQLDFSAKKPAGIEPEINEVLNSKEKIVLNGISTPNIHDFLNLPVKYSSSKFVYPLVSSSYANLKYQGSNKNYITNKKPTTVVAPVTPMAPKYHSENYFTVSSTKLMPVAPTESSSTSTVASTSSRPTNPTVSSTLATTTRTPTTTTRRATTTRRPVPISVTTTSQPVRSSTTRKKFVPTRKQYTHSTTSTSSPNTTDTIVEQQLPKQQPKPTQTSSAVTFTTHHPTPQADIFPTEPTTSAKMYSTPSVRPLLVSGDDFGSSSTTPQALTPIVDSTKIPNLDPADVYHTLGQKNNKAQQQQSAAKPTMTLSDIFNNLAEEEVAVANNYQQNQGFDSQGNLIEPIAPSQPSPFAMQPQQSHPATTQNQNPYSTDQKLISAGPESDDNQYVSYQVQQPNVMQYRPIPGQINNVVISPGQQSASFVLGSQQQVSHPSNVKSEGQFSVDTGSVQYGQVINEEIANIKRPMPSNQHQQQFSSAQQPTPPSIYQQRPNYHSNTKFQTNTNIASVAAPETPLTGNAAGPGSYQELPPEAPTPYQQLPLIGSNLGLKKQPSKVADETFSTALATPPKNQPVHSTMSTSAQVQPLATSQDTKELLVSTNIRFPSNQDDSLNMPPAGVAPGPPISPHINGHAQPLSLQQIQNANPVVFPKISDEEATGSNVQIQQHEVVNIKQHQQQLTFPTQQLSKNEQPSQEMVPPPRYAPLHHSQVQRPNDSPSAPFYKEFDRKSQTQPQAGPRPNVNLPNILPQFRPNAKISIGHPSNLKQEPGNIRLPTQGMRAPYNPSTAPQFSNRRQPMQQPQLQNRYPLNRISEYSAVNRRVYRLPPNGGQRMPQLRDRMYSRRPNGPLRAIDGYYPVERHAPITPQPSKLNSGDLDDYEEEDLVINDPPQTPNKDIQNTNESKLEAVVTLQMLQSQKKPLNGDDTGAGEIQVTAEHNPQEALATKVIEQTSHPKSKLASQRETEGIASENRDSMLHPESAALTAVEYQNTPFSVIREQPQEPILKNKKPQSLQQQAKIQPLHKQKFPYPIEKPDPSYTELQPSLQVPGVLVAPRIITAALNTGTEAPIAIAYTPTEPNPYPRSDPTKQEQQIVNVKYEMRPETQTEEILGNDFDLRGHNFEKDFMAPFYPSVSLGGASTGVTSNPTLSNWKIVPSASEQKLYEKNSISRADIEVAADKKQLQPGNTTNSSTEKHSELDSFQPQLQGGFKPIFPADYVHTEQKDTNSYGEKVQSTEDNNRPIALALVGSQTTPPQTIRTSATTSGSSTTTASTTTTTTTPTTLIPDNTNTSTAEIDKKGETTTKSPVNQSGPTIKKKSTFETSLAALLFGDDDELGDGARKSFDNEEASVRPINVARMGPRSLVLS
ncbi:mucin-17 [Drosophila novamexicana]|uniref:mucin-17 n=1 Tax=Drosophila novamexicana TaxID=47314 RepID=UPI0011E6003E|nr:mucin-17 [Drosophila novamexicana]